MLYIIYFTIETMNKISNWVKYCLKKIPFGKGYVLDLACGRGRHSVFLSDLGYNVLSVDINKKSLNSFDGKLIKKKAIDIENVNNWPLGEKKFYIVIVTNFLNRKIFPLIIDSISKGGYLVYETFSEGHEKIGKPSNPEYILKPKELIKLSNKMEFLEYENIYINNPSNHSYKQSIFVKHV